MAALSKEEEAALDNKILEAHEPYIEGKVYRLSAHIRIAVAEAS